MKPISIEIQTTIDDVDVTVKAKVHSLGHPGAMYARNGDPGDPPEGPEVELLSVVDVDGVDVLESLDEGQLIRLEDAIVERCLDREAEQMDY